ncbi:MAG: TlyA family RNA methyltransferase [Clostridia bacterium]|nr:TlyA family RNA methyltransferase [Clostridia bacterium]
MRADKYFAEKFGSRTKAAEAIEKGWVLVNGKAIKPKTEITETDTVTIVQPKDLFVSNGGYKLDRAIKAFGVDCKGKTFADIGASTGGFTDCLLQNGAKKVYAIDVGESLLHESLQDRSEIVRMENTNARYLTKTDFSDDLDGVVTDVSFISLRLIFPVIKEILKETGEAFVLIKPQFECEKKHIGKSGIVAPSAHAEIVKKVLGYLYENGLFAYDIVNAPVRKGKNIEYVLRCGLEMQKAKKETEILAKIKEFVQKNSAGELQ